MMKANEKVKSSMKMKKMTIFSSRNENVNMKARAKVNEEVSMMAKEKVNMNQKVLSKKNEKVNMKMRA